MDDYRRIADRIADGITGGRLRPGQRLPPQRAFARRHKIAASTAGRVYAELVRRGLVVGEVGRGTFVRATEPDRQPGHALTEAAGVAPVNLELNYPSAPGQPELLAPALASLLRPDALAEALRPAPAAGTAAAREAVAGLLATGGLRPGPDRILFTGNARQAIAATLASLVRPGGRVGVEPLTYPLVKEIAGRLGIDLVPLAADEEGPLAESVAAAHRTAPLSALYLQPTLHNPTSLTLGAERRAHLADVIHSLGIPVVEDRIWSFLHAGGEPPLAALLPDLVHLVDGLSKRVAPGLTIGFVVAPADRAEAVARAVRSGGWNAGSFALEAAVRWTGDGTVARLVAAKRRDAERRQRLVAEELDGFAVRSDPAAYFAWWQLPAPWRADTFTAVARAHGIAVTPGTAFSVDPSRTPNAVRLGLASAPEPELAGALRILAGLARGRADAGSG
ncbi:GntR family transcriptional regulator [Streptomyces cellostaticus]|uniref:GntR family transcriptional regulator n=1 Tax=Streptomyces cellostaticus TaxID=67285 RepID=A0A117PTU4_9ACTN|nr:PLP-dependent aminotransferase family protein [Streptomyces cellostaticus]KUM91578.1 GntR family transcriptional regulator [Streptomyces cellostaticus]GHI06284.1 GntR family transcriptional regulator [Streptomyces cellostaticus]